MQVSDPVLVALAALIGLLVAEVRQWLIGRKQTKMQLSEIEQRIATDLLSKLESRLVSAEGKIAALELEVRDLRRDRDRLERELATVIHERDALLVEREGLLNRLSVLVMPEVIEHHEQSP